MLSFLESNKIDKNDITVKYCTDGEISKLKISSIISVTKHSIFYSGTYGCNRLSFIKKYNYKPYTMSKLKLQNEIEIFNMISKCKTFSRIYHGICTSSTSMLIMEPFVMGNLSCHLANDKALSLKQIRIISENLINGLSFLQKNNIILRSLSLKTIQKTYLYSSIFSIKISDFSYAIDLKKHPKPIDRVGSVIYQAPETIAGLEQSHVTDMWAFGIVIFLLCTGNHPFITNYEADAKTVDLEIFKACFSKESRNNELTDPTLREIIKLTLVKSPIFRITAIYLHV